MDDKKKKYFMEPQLKLIEQKSILEMTYPDSILVEKEPGHKELLLLLSVVLSQNVL